MPFTIRDLAKRLNLSITTVSRALDGYSDVAESTRARVVQAASEMGYTPSSAARQLRRRHSDAIGYILPTSSPRFSDPFYTAFSDRYMRRSSRTPNRFDRFFQPTGKRLRKSDLSTLVSKRASRWLALKPYPAGRLANKLSYREESSICYVRSNSYQIKIIHVTVNERGGFERLVTHLVRKRPPANSLYWGSHPI